MGNGSQIKPEQSKQNPEPGLKNHDRGNEVNPNPGNGNTDKTPDHRKQTRHQNSHTVSQIQRTEGPPHEQPDVRTHQVPTEERKLPPPGP